MRYCISIILLAAVAWPIQAQFHRVDRYGDPFPEAAIARLGTLRLVHLGQLSSVAVSPNGKVVASGVAKGERVYLGERIVHQEGTFTLGEGVWLTQAKIRLWDAATGQRIRELSTFDAPVSALHFGRGGDSLFAGCGKFLCAWDLSNGTKRWEREAIPGARFNYGVHANSLLQSKGRLISTHGGSIMCVVRIKGGSAYYYHHQNVVRIWDAKTGKPQPLPPDLESTIVANTKIASLFHQVGISPDGRYIAVIASEATPEPRDPKEHTDKWKYKNRRLMIVHLQTGKVAHTLPVGDKEIRLLTFTNNGSTLAFTGDGEIWLVDTRTGQKELLAQNLPAAATKFRFVTPRQLAGEFRDEIIRVWDIQRCERVDPHAVDTHSFADAWNGNTAVRINNNTLAILDADSGKLRHTFPGHRLTPSVRFALDAKNALHSRDTEAAFHWDPHSWAYTESMIIPHTRTPWRWYRWRNVEMDDGLSLEKQLVLIGEGKSIELRDLKNDRLVRSIRDCDEDALHESFSANGSRLAVREGKSLHLYDVATGKRLSTLPVRDNWWFAGSDRFSPSGKYFAANHGHVEIVLYDCNSGKIARRLVPRFHDKEKKQGSVLGFQFSADEKYVLAEVHQQTGFENGFSAEKVTITIWDVNTGEMIQDILIWPEVHVFWRQTLNEAYLDRLALSPDHRFVALTHTNGKAIEIWEVASGTRRGVLSGHDGVVASLAFSPDGRRLASSSEDTTILIWDLDRPFRRGIYPSRLSEAELMLHWHTLLESDAWRADDAIWCMIRAARASVPFLKAHISPVKRPDAEFVRKSLAALDSNDFRTRVKAETDLEKMGELILAELQNAVKQNNITLEKRRRIDTLLQKALHANQPFATAERTRQWRALEVLERIGKPDSLAVLREIAGGLPGARLTVAAQQAVTRQR
jgi:WD40 repeat protein